MRRFNEFGLLINEETVLKYAYRIIHDLDFNFFNVDSRPQKLEYYGYV